MKKKKLNGISFVQVILMTLVFIIIVISVYPVIWMILTSVKPPYQFSRSMLELPDQLFFRNYYDAWTRGNFGRYYINTVVVTVTGLFLVVGLGSMIGFAIEKMRWKLSKFTLKIFLSGIMIPGVMLLLPQFLIFKSVGLYNNLLSIIAAITVGQLPISVFLFSTFYRYLPNDVMESAVIDGCSIPQVFFRIVLPLTTNTVLTVIICGFSVFWNDFVVANTFTTDVNMKTVQVGISFFMGFFTLTEWGPIFAGLCIGTLPTVIVYLFLNQRVLTGVAEGSVKG